VSAITENYTCTEHLASLCLPIVVHETFQHEECIFRQIFVDFSFHYVAFWRLAVWFSGNALASMNVVALRQTRLVPGWVTVCGRVNHLGM